MRSFVAVKESQPVQVELFKGSVYFDIKKNATNQLEVKVGNAIIKNTGTRFSIQMQKDGNSHIAVADGHIKIQVASGTYQINALEQAEFDDVRIRKHSLITEHDIAPWRSDPWLMDYLLTEKHKLLCDLVCTKEILRQRTTKPDIPNPTSNIA